MSVCSSIEMLILLSGDERIDERVETSSAHCEEEGESLRPSLVSAAPRVFISWTSDADIVRLRACTA